MKGNNKSATNSYHGKISNSPAMFVPAVFSSVKSSKKAVSLAKSNKSITSVKTTKSGKPC